MFDLMSANKKKTYRFQPYLNGLNKTTQNRNAKRALSTEYYTIGLRIFKYQKKLLDLTGKTRVS